MMWSVIGKFKTEIIYMTVHDITIEGMAKSFMCVESRVSHWFRCTHPPTRDAVCGTIWFGYALLGKYVYVVNF